MDFKKLIVPGAIFGAMLAAAHLAGRKAHTQKLDAPDASPSKEPWQMTREEFETPNIGKKEINRFYDENENLLLEEEGDLTHTISTVKSHEISKNAYTMEHTHPERSGFSENDVNLFMLSQQKRMRVVMPDGCKWCLEKPSGWHYPTELSGYELKKSFQKIKKDNLMFGNVNRTFTQIWYDESTQIAKKFGLVFYVNYTGSHWKYVSDAMMEGKPVPPEVLADYPDLKGAKLASPDDQRTSEEYQQLLAEWFSVSTENQKKAFKSIMNYEMADITDWTGGLADIPYSKAMKIMRKGILLDEKKGDKLNAPDATPTIALQKLYRAADYDDGGSGTCWMEDKDDAKAYLNNPPFGGDTLYMGYLPEKMQRTTYDGERIGKDKELMIAFYKNLHKKSSQYKEDDEIWDEIRSDGILETVEGVTNRKYPFAVWEESEGVREILMQRGYTNIRYTDDFPDGARARYILDGEIVNISQIS